MTGWLGGELIERLGMAVHDGAHLNALAARRSVAYALDGHVLATPQDGRQRRFEVERDSALSPVPGLPGVLR